MANASIAQMGSISGFYASGEDLIKAIYDYEDTKIGKKLSRKPLRHVTIVSEDGNSFRINDSSFVTMNNLVATPLNDTGTLVEIRTLSPEQDCDLQVMYLR